MLIFIETGAGPELEVPTRLLLGYTLAPGTGAHTTRIPGES